MGFVQARSLLMGICCRQRVCAVPQRYVSGIWGLFTDPTVERRIGYDLLSGSGSRSTFEPVLVQAFAVGSTHVGNCAVKQFRSKRDPKQSLLFDGNPHCCMLT